MPVTREPSFTPASAAPGALGELPPGRMQQPSGQRPLGLDDLVGAITGITQHDLVPTGATMSAWDNSNWWTSTSRVTSHPIPGRAPIQGSSPAARAIAIGKQQLGDPYVWGAEGPNAFDCSGLVWYSFSQAGLPIVRTTANGYKQMSAPVSKANLQPGDLVFFNFGRLGGGEADHVAIYLGGGKMLTADHPGDPVGIDPVPWSNFIGGGRLPGAGSANVASPASRATSGARGVLAPAPPQRPDLSLVPLYSTMGVSGAYPQAPQAVAGLLSPGMATVKAPPPGAKPTQANIIAYVKSKAAHYGVPYWIMLGLVQAESSFHQSSVSRTGAIGLSQLEPGTAAGLGVDPNNWQQNLDGGMHYLSEQFKRFGSWLAALGAYNAGPGNYQAGINNGYAARVLQYARSYR